MRDEIIALCVFDQGPHRRFAKAQLDATYKFVFITKSIAKSLV